MRRAIAFAVAAVLTLTLALQGGGYDIVPRQEVAMVVWSMIALGFAFDLFPRGRFVPSADLPLFALAALAGLTCLGLTWTESSERTVEEVARVVGYSGFVVLPYVSLNRYTARAAGAGIAAAVLALPILALASRLTPGLIGDPTVVALNVDRLSYPLGYWNAVACWAAMAIAVGLIWSAHAGDVRARCAAMASVPVAGLALYLTYSRAGVIALMVAIIAAVALSRRRWTVAFHVIVAGLATAAAVAVVRSQPEIARATGSEGAGLVLLTLIAGAAACASAVIVGRRLGLDAARVPRETARIAVAAAAVLAVALAVIVARGPIEDAWDEFRNEGAVRTADPSARLSSFGGSRYEIWSSSIDAFQSEPARGIGPGTFEFWWSAEGGEAEFLRDAHSLYLETLAELGIFGAGLLFLALGSLLVVALRARSRLTRTADFNAAAAMTAAFCVFVIYAAVDWVWEIPALVIVSLGGIAIAGAAGFRRWGGRELPPLARLAAVMIALVCVAVQVPSLVSIERLRASADELRAGDTERAQELAQDSVDAQPWAASPYVQRALVSEARGDLAGARADMLAAVERESTNWRHRLLLAQIAARQGDAAEVQRQLEAAQRLSPNSVFLQPNSAFRLQLDALLATDRR